ncbi:hypothetical protein K432DRAFT_426405 [Lepidopterella palustris CBS 459.81]|uniref:P-loop containing nucleoside triphosphate hydrolase protein n=1 Tax=Lepidopterella palustris CBS 459.81 TaxID=1314670 RepID=A0A8E2E997_9PEZI|nr:hypothetical protein K432DRAFT_426405 [Lepidopterella palustris CBS 459.81]
MSVPEYDKHTVFETVVDEQPTEDRSSKEDTNAFNDGKEEDQDDRNDKDERDYIRQVGWKALFSFTTKKHTGVLLGAIFFAVIAGLILPAQSVLYGLIFNQFANHGSGKITGAVLLANVSKYCIYVVALGAGSWVSNGVYFIFWLTFGEMQAKSARDRMFNNMLSKDMVWYDLRRNGVAAFLPRVQMQIRELQIAASQPMGEVFQCLVTGIGSLVIALYFSWSLTLVTICTVPIVYIVMASLSSRMETNVHQQGEKLQEALKYLTTAFQSIETVKCCNGQEAELWKYSRATKAAARYYIRQANLQSFQMGFMQLATLAMFVQGFWYGSSLIESGKKNPGQVITTFWAALMAVQSITGFLPQIIVLEKGRIASAKLRAVMAQLQDDGMCAGKPEGTIPSNCKGDIEMKQVSFAYPARPNHLALSDTTLSFPAGETTFVIGKSGSGKSTLGQLLLRFYEPSGGEILLDGHPLQTLDAHWLRSKITLVEQQSVLFKDTIYGNIALAKWEYGKVDLDDVKEAAQFALIQQMINDLPDGFNTVVGSKGNTMSGGQRQRMALARARLRDTPILILDESTSALDQINRSLMLDAIRLWRRGKTTIIITHDISQILPEDYVYVLSKAQVVQEGYRNSMENDKGTPFHTFLASPVLEEENNLDEPEDHCTEDLLSFYTNSGKHAESWNTESDILFENLDPLHAFLDERVDLNMPRLSVAHLSHIGTSARPNSGSAVPHMASPYWRFMPNSSEPNILIHANSPVVSYVSGTRSIHVTAPGHHPPGIVRHTTENKTQHISRNERLAARSRLAYCGDENHETIGKASRSMTLVKTKTLRRLRRKQAEEQPAKVQPVSMSAVLTTVWPRLDWISRLVLIAAVFAACIHAAATPTFSYIFSRLVSTFYNPANRSQMALLYSLAILGIAIIDGIASYCFHFMLEYCAQVWVNNTKAEAMRRLLDQPRDFFDRDENSVSKLAKCLDHFAEETRNILGRFTGIIFVVIFMMCIALVWSLISCWKLTLVALGISPILYAITTSYRAICAKWEGHSNDADEVVGTILHETFTNIRTVRSLTLEKAFSQRYIEATTGALKTGFKRAIYSGIFFSLNNSSILFVTAFLFWYGATVVSSGEFGTTNVIQTFTLLLLSTSFGNSMIALIPQMGGAKDAAARFLRLANLPQTSHEHTGTIRIPAVGNIVIQNLKFAYPTRPDQLVLRNVNINIPAGSCVAIVGASGSGKSTIASLLLKFYPTDPNYDMLSGTQEITLSGRDIKRIHTPTLRSLVAIVSQTPIIFPGTIAENIAYGLPASSPHTSLPSIRSAAAAAGIDEFINSLPSGYYTVIGDGGMGVSGGQAQRIAIARALVRKPNVLVLDEATSALDVESAAIIRESICRLVAESQEGVNVASNGVETRKGIGSGRSTPMGQRGGTGSGQNTPISQKGGTGSARSTAMGQRGMTVVIITHAKEMMAIADHIFMLDQGRVVEEGSFEGLKRKKGEFARLLRGGEWDDGKGQDRTAGEWKGKAKDMRV